MDDLLFLFPLYQIARNDPNLPFRSAKQARGQAKKETRNQRRRQKERREQEKMVDHGFAVADGPARSILSWSQFMARFGGNLARILLSMRRDFLWSSHLFSPPTFSPPYLPGILFHVLRMHINSTPPTRSWKALSLSHAKRTHHLPFLYLIASTSSITQNTRSLFLLRWRWRSRRLRSMSWPWTTASLTGSSSRGSSRHLLFKVSIKHAMILLIPFAA